MPERLRKRWPWVLGGAAVVAAILVVAVAAGVIGGSPGGMTPYRSQSLGFSFNYPSDWTVSQEAEGLVSIVSPEGDAALMASVWQSQAGTPEEAAEALCQELQAEAGQFSDLAPGSRQRISVDGRPAVLQSAQYTHRGETAQMLAAVILDGGQQYNVWLVSQDGSVKNPQGTMEQVLAGFDTR